MKFSFFLFSFSCLLSTSHKLLGKFEISAPPNTANNFLEKANETSLQPSRACEKYELKGKNFHKISPEIFSDYAHFENNHLLLKGHVRIYDALGWMQANEADLEKKKKEDAFSKIFLRKEVTCLFQEDTTLSCETAFIDLNHGKGYASSLNTPLYYQSLWESTKKPFSISSEKIDFTFSQNHKKIKTIDTLHAYEKVKIDYDHAFYLQCNKAILANEKLTALSTPSSICKLTHFDKALQAKKMIFDLDTERLDMEIVQGQIPSFLSKNEASSLSSFSAKHLVWNRQNSKILLESDVMFSNPFLGTLNTKHQLFLLLEENQKKYSLQKIQAIGDTRLSLKGKHLHEIDQLRCFGTLELDHQLFVLTGKSPKTEGQVLLSQQLILEKKELIFYADHLEVKYRASQKSFDPLSIHLQGRVRVISKTFLLPFQYSLSDEVIYDPKAHEMIFLSKNENGVLFWDKKGNAQLSGKHFLVSLDPITKKEKIKGIGKAYFSFHNKEKAILHQFFPHAILTHPLTKSIP